MPITFILAPLFFLVVILAALLIPISIILFVLTRKKIALLLLLPPMGFVCMSVYMCGRYWIHDVAINMLPTRTFVTTFGFMPDKQTEVLDAHISHGLDFRTVFIKFKTTRETIDKIVQNKFQPIPSGTFQESYSSNRHNLPEHVRAWFNPDFETNNLFYLAEPFNNSFKTVNEAVLCYNEQTGIAYFHWRGLD